jgi:hypothetical protein
MKRGEKKMISSVDIRVNKINNDFSEREHKILEVLLTNLAALTNGLVNGGGMALNPLEKNEGDILNRQLVFEKPITVEKYEDFKQGIVTRFNNSLKRCEISEVQIMCVEK